MDEQLTREDIKAAVREAMGEKFELLFGVDCFDPVKREEARANWAFLCKLRLAFEDTSKRIGQIVIWGIIVGALAIAGLGLKEKILPPF